MTLSAYARDIINRARVNCYATDASKASDALIRPFGEHDDQRASLRALQEATIGLCWVNSEGELVPFDEAEFAGIQREITNLQAKIDHNDDILDALDDKVAELGLTEFSISKLKGQIEKLRSQINQIRAEENDSLRSKWESVVSLGGNRATYDKLPEVIEARAKAAAQIEPIEAEIKALNGQIRSLESILSKFKR
jgi:chromosome segregation ATPase